VKISWVGRRISYWLCALKLPEALAEDGECTGLLHTSYRRKRGGNLQNHQRKVTKYNFVDG
jgi:hypothetical protein